MKWRSTSAAVCALIVLEACANPQHAPLLSTNGGGASSTANSSSSSTAGTSTSGGTSGSSSSSSSSTGSGTTTSSSTGTSSTTGGSTTGSPACALGDGGLFAAPQTFYTDAGGNFPYGMNIPLAVGDFDGDGNLDIALNLMSQSALGVFFGRGDGSFDPFVSFSGVVVTPANVLPVSIGDPARTDLVVVDLAAPPDGGAQLVVLSVSTERGLNVVASLPLTINDYNDGIASVADLNGDGVPDFIVGGDDTTTAFLEVFLSDADGGWRHSGSVAAWSYNNGFVGDFNEDGMADVVALNPTGQPTLLSLFLGTGGGSLAPGTVVAMSSGFESSIYSFVIGDLNGDGHLDLLVSDQSGVDNGWTPYLGGGDGTFATGNPAMLGDSLWGHELFALSDVVADGHLDYVGVQLWTNTMLFGANLGYAVGNGDGTFQAWVNAFAFDGGVNAVVLGDVNNDGWPDVIVSDHYTQQVSVLLNNCGGAH